MVSADNAYAAKNGFVTAFELYYEELKINSNSIISPEQKGQDAKCFIPKSVGAIFALIGLV